MVVNSELLQRFDDGVDSRQNVVNHDHLAACARGRLAGGPPTPAHSGRRQRSGPPPGHWLRGGFVVFLARLTSESSALRNATDGSVQRWLLCGATLSEYVRHRYLCQQIGSSYSDQKSRSKSRS